MTKREKKISVIQQELEKCVSTSAAEYYTYGNIPTKCIAGACKSYVGSIDYDDILGLIDTTVFGGGERGMVFTTDGVYCKEILTETQYCKYSNIGDFTLPGETYFNLDGLQSMLIQLYDIETEPENSGGLLNGLLDLAGTLADTFVESYIDSYEKERIKQERKGTEEVIEMLESLKMGLKTMKSLLSESIVPYDEISDNLFAYFIEISIYSCVFANDKEKLKEILQLLDQEMGEEYESMMSSFSEIAVFDECFSETQEFEEKIRLYDSIKVFHSKTINIFEDALEYIADENADVDEWTELYERSQRSISNLKKKVSAYIKNVNLLIESGYEELEE